MDQNGSSSSATEEIETSNTNRSNKYDHLFMKKTLQFLVPISVLSFLLAYASCFSFIFTYNFHFSTLVFALFSRALERKYMFLICNGILAFLVKTLSFNSCSSPSASDFIQDEPMKTTEDQRPTSWTEKAVPYGESAVPVQYYNSISKSAAVEEEEEEKHEKKVYINDSDEQEEEKAPESGKEVKSQMGSSLIIESDDIYSSEDDYETDMEESAAAAAASLLGASIAEEGNEINLNTEELNQKFEEFIRKMKEEIRIEAQQQLVVA